MMSKVFSGVENVLGGLTGGKIGTDAKADKKKSKKRAKNAADEKKRADDLTNAFGRTLLNDPLGNSGSLLQGRPGSAGGGGSVLGR
jgi:hypothetical protein